MAGKFLKYLFIMEVIYAALGIYSPFLSEKNADPAIHEKKRELIFSGVCETVSDVFNLNAHAAPPDNPGIIGLGCSPVDVAYGYRFEVKGGLISPIPTELFYHADHCNDEYCLFYLSSFDIEGLGTHYLEEGIVYSFRVLAENQYGNRSTDGYEPCDPKDTNCYDGWSIYVSGAAETHTMPSLSQPSINGIEYPDVLGQYGNIVFDIFDPYGIDCVKLNTDYGSFEVQRNGNEWMFSVIELAPEEGYISLNVDLEVTNRIENVSNHYESIVFLYDTTKPSVDCTAGTDGKYMFISFSFNDINPLKGYLFIGETSTYLPDLGSSGNKDINVPMNAVQKGQPFYYSVYITDSAGNENYRSGNPIGILNTPLIIENAENLQGPNWRTGGCAKPARLNKNKFTEGSRSWALPYNSMKNNNFAIWTLDVDDFILSPCTMLDVYQDSNNLEIPYVQVAYQLGNGKWCVGPCIQTKPGWIEITFPNNLKTIPIDIRGQAGPGQNNLIKLIDIFLSGNITTPIEINKEIVDKVAIILRNSNKTKTYSFFGKTATINDRTSYFHSGEIKVDYLAQHTPLGITDQDFNNTGGSLEAPSNTPDLSNVDTFQLEAIDLPDEIDVYFRDISGNEAHQLVDTSVKGRFYNLEKSNFTGEINWSNIEDVGVKQINLNSKIIGVGILRPFVITGTLPEEEP